MSRTATAVILSLIAITEAQTGLGQTVPDSPSWRLLRASEAEQIAAVKSALDQGLFPAQFETVGLLFLNRSSLVLPLVESKIEQVLRSPSPLYLFCNKQVDTNRFVDRAALAIAETGNEQALKEIGKLIKLDEERFGMLVARALDNSRDYAKSHNPFVVAYGGLALGDPAINQRIATWAESKLTVDPEERAKAEAAARGFGPTPPPPAEKMKHLWAEAMLDRYGAVPTERDWAGDPIASRLQTPLTESLRDEVPRLALEAFERRPPK